MDRRTNVGDCITSAKGGGNEGYAYTQLLLAERAQNRDFSVQMWNSKMLYLTASHATVQYF